MLIGYLCVINSLGFVVCTADKRAAVKSRRRERESTLFALAFIGGALGIWVSMLIFRHKTKKLKFTLVMPIFVLVNALLFYFFFTKLYI